MGKFSRCVVVALATVALAGGVHAQQDASGATPTTQVDMTATLQALQTAVDNKDATAIFSILNSVPRDQRGPAGLAIVNTLPSTNVTGGFGSPTTNTSDLLIANLVVTDNQNQTQASTN
jgi:hypothetical protein